MDVKLCEISCISCGVSFWITNRHDDELRRFHDGFYCPNGHRQFYPSQTATEKVKEERDRYKKEYNEEKETRQKMDRSNAALRGVITKNKKALKEKGN